MSKKITVVPFIIATGSIFFANPSVIAQESTSSINNSSRILNKIKNENILNWGYRYESFPVSYRTTTLQEPAGLCAELMILLENYLKDEKLANDRFQIKSESVQNRFDGTRLKDPSTPPKFDIECGANTIREDEEGIVFSKPFASSNTKILILKSKKKFFNDVLSSQNRDSVNLGMIENSTSKNRIQVFFPHNSSIKSFKTKGKAIKALEEGVLEGFVNDEILLTGILKEGEISNPQEYVVYRTPKRIFVREYNG
ncbi:MAG: transporter substrate-binding domain-containing protein [Okeania sp. SIO2G4]|uniref:transporter substrate-binding domain-containing protein n=1 Tax=unclassified Okeania TaxID=2634635 RepID=UPI0013B6554A|nr:MULTISPECIES: transporter substrate-binding domain-containing protein [unclassified Okeania]NEP40859.1 transporter substrate-binding domain-containing protein [Okeania sp. SIO2H7]NEP73746.1 transporter substrate-binding domain-containing protein [Okeania sp. SIO2G5]NEP95844.1 transporter substrate-binding domain-containing protein [Okeania sp. SIO2F5]NEQ92239.1 transporter substrate-binding domain-containing protein [Okeania sp. SIO2G4]